MSKPNEGFSGGKSITIPLISGASYVTVVAGSWSNVTGGGMPYGNVYDKIPVYESHPFWDLYISEDR